MVDHSQDKVVVLFGGESAERQVSLRSGKAVLNALVRQGINACAFDPAQNSLAQLVTENVTKAVIMLHGRGGEDGAIQGALQSLRIPYSGSGVLGSALAMDKVRSKQVFQALSLPTANYKAVHKADIATLDLAAVMAEFNDHIMVKPSLEGSSIGMTRVTSVAALSEALQVAREYDSTLLLEQYIVGKEYTVAILGDEALPTIRMETPRTFYDYEAKYHTDSTVYHCPAGLSDAEEKKVAQLALKAFRAVGASGWGRVDLMCDEAGNYYLLEVNTVPGMTEKSLVPMAAKAAGMSFDDLSLQILESCNDSD